MAESTSKKAATSTKAKAAKAQTTAKKAAESAPSTAKDAVNTVIGFGVMGINKVQSSARDLAKTDEVTSRLSKVVDQAAEAAKSTSKSATGVVSKADERIEAAITKAEDAFETYEEKLPAQVRDISRKARETGRNVRAQVRSKVLSA